MKLKLKNKILLLKIGYNILGYSIIALILVIAYFHNKLIETSITMVLFFIYRTLFEKQYHAKSLFLCGVISVIVFAVVIHIEVSLTISILFSAMLTFLMTLISYYVRDYFDNKIKLKRIKQLNTKAVEYLTLDELLTRLPNVKENIIRIVHGYWHRDRNVTLLEYVDSCEISQSLLYNYINKVKKAYKDLTEIC